MAITPTLGTRTAALAAAVLLALTAGCGTDDGDADPTSGPSSSSASEPGSPSDSGEPTSTGEPSDPTEPPTTAPIPDGTPACSEVWVDGAMLPRTYSGCAEGETYVKSDRLGCSSGQRIVRYADRFYAVAGSDITETSGPLMQDRDYGDAVARCRG